MSMERIEFRNLRMEYGEVAVIQNIDFAVEPGEILCLFGPSGCGKSTVLKAALGILLPAAGKVRIGNVEASEYSFPIAYVPQGNELLPWLNVVENVGLWHRESAKKSLVRTALEPKVTIDTVGLTQAETKMPHQLSGGMMRRTALARCLATHATICLLDEAFTSVERRLRRKLMVGVRAHLKQNNMAALLVSHDYEEATFMSDRVVFLTAVPAEISKVVVVNLPPERDDELFQDEQFTRATLELLAGM